MEMQDKYVHKRRADNIVGQTGRQRGIGWGVATGRYKIKSKLALETTLLMLWGQWVWARLKTIYGVF